MFALQGGNKQEGRPRGLKTTVRRLGQSVRLSSVKCVEGGGWDESSRGPGPNCVLPSLFKHSTETSKKSVFVGDANRNAHMLESYVSRFSHFDEFFTVLWRATTWLS